MKKIILITILSIIFFFNNTFADWWVIKDIVIKYIGDNTTINWVSINNNIKSISIDETWIIKNKVTKDDNWYYYLNGEMLNGEEVIFLDDGWIILDKSNVKEWEKYYINYNWDKVFEGNLEEYKRFKKDNFVILNNWKPLTESISDKRPNLYEYFIDKDFNSHKFALKFNKFNFLGIENDLIYDVLCKDNNLVLNYKWKDLTELIWSKEIVFFRLNNLYWIRPNISLIVDWENILLDKEDDININWCTFNYNWFWKKYNIEVKNSHIKLTNSSENNIWKTEYSISTNNAKIKIKYYRQFIWAKNNLKKISNDSVINWLNQKLDTVKEKIKKEATQKQKIIVEKLYKGIDKMNNKYQDNEWKALIEYIKSYFELHFYDL